jgi:hypothetical protein
VVNAQRERGALFSNPITDYFRTPLNSLASARGVARGYVQNLVIPGLKGKIVQGPSFAVGKAGLQFQTILPNRLKQATRESVEKVFQRKRIEPIVVEAPGRRITAYIWANHKEANGDPIIVDIPTAMAPLYGNVLARLGPVADNDPNSPDFRFLEDDEIGQFFNYLGFFARDAAEKDNSLVIANYRKLSVAECFEPDLFD